ncbi:MAG TPA: potassium channel family protein [Spirillospora sp.]
MNDPEAVRRPPVMLPTPVTAPLRAVARRIAIALVLLLSVVVVVYADRGGYRDGADGTVSLLDAFYYASVTISTTGYGDITPVSDTARFVNVVFITPVRVLFLIVLVGTTLEVLAERTREDWRKARWRTRVRDHIVVAGYGTKGRSAINTLLSTGVSRESIVVVDPDPRVVAEATEAGFVGIVGDATRSSVLKQAAVHRAREVVVASARDDTAVLVTLTARQLNPHAGIQASVRESENVPLLRQSGADHVVTSSEAAGRLLGVTTSQPNVGQVIEDLLHQGSGLDLGERGVRPDEVGKPAWAVHEPVLALVRDGRLLPYDHPGCKVLQADDRMIIVRSKEAAKAKDQPAAETDTGTDTGKADGAGTGGGRFLRKWGK